MKKQNKDTRMEYYFIHSKIFSRVLGQWPYQSKKSLIFFRYFWIVQHVSIMLPEGIKLFENRGNFDLVIEALSPFIYNMIMAVKFGGGMLYQQKIKSMLEKVKKDWNLLLDEKEIQILKQISNSGKSLNNIYMCMVYFVLLSYMLFPLSPVILNLIKPLQQPRQKTPLYMVEMYIDQKKYHWPILIHAYITSLLGVVPLFGSDFFLWNFVHHACGILKIIGYRFQNIFKAKELKKKSVESEYNETIKIIIQHQRIIQFCNDLNDVYRISYLLVLLLCILTLSITGTVAIIKLEENFRDFIRFSLFSGGQIFHLFCYNYIGQKLLNSGEELNKNFWNVEWYAASQKTKSLINFALQRSLKPNKIQAIIFPLTLTTFSSVMKTSMSYLTVLKSSR